MMPAPGRPKLPSSSCSSAQQPMICGPLVCCVHATAYANDVVRSAPEFARMVVGDFQERVARTPGRALDHLRRVAAEMPLDDLEDAARVLQRLVTRRRRLQQRSDQRVVRRARAAAACWLRARWRARRLAGLRGRRRPCPDRRRGRARTASSGRRTGRRTRCTATPARRRLYSMSPENTPSLSSASL